MDHPGNPMNEGMTTAARGVAELMAALVMAMQYYRQSQEAIKASKANREAQSVALEDRQRRRDQSQWSLALDKGWMRTAATDEVIRVWSSALPWAHDEVRALQARRFAEARLDQLDPDLMRRYRKRLDEGSDPARAMWNARQLPEPVPAFEASRSAPVRETMAELGPAKRWEAGPAQVPALTQGQLLELGPAGAWPMSPAGWTESGGRDDLGQVLAASAAGWVNRDAPQAVFGGLSVRQRLAAAAATVQAEQARPSFATSQTDFDRGTGTRPCGAPVGGEPISRPIVTGPGAGFKAVRARRR
jgi:hypothetical protein